MNILVAYCGRHFPFSALIPYQAANYLRKGRRQKCNKKKAGEGEVGD